MPESAAGKSYVAAIRSAFCEVRSDKPVKRSPQRRYSLESAACSDEAEPGKCRRPAATCPGRLLPFFFDLGRLYVGYKELHKRLQRVTKGTIRKCYKWFT